ncbi:MAG: tetratricopeptide repeat protein [Nitrospirae bacterium]|nr:tetratricopeptide repeat protein [Nitrospirota bacterium]
MKASIVILAIFFLTASGIEAFGATDIQAGGAQSSYNFADGIKYRAEGNCEDAVKSYQMARELRQFKEDWIYYLAIADCLVVLKRFDEAIDAYTRVIASTQNRTLQGEMYKGRARTYYLKAASPDNIDIKIVALAKKDVEHAMGLGVDVSDLEKTIRDDTEAKPARVDAEQGKTVITDKPVTIVERSDKLIIGNGEYVVYVSGDTRINDQKGTAIPPSEIKAGDVIDFSYTMSYQNKADSMTHLSASTILLHRDVAPKQAGMEERLPNSTEMLILSQLTTLSAEINNLRARQQAMGRKEAGTKTIKKHTKRKKKVEEIKAKALKTAPAINP